MRSPTPKRRARRVEALQSLLGVGHRVGRHLDRRAVVRPQHQQPVGPGVAARQQVGERGEVAERLRHLGALDLDPPVVHPVAGERLAVGDRLGPLVLVVREGQVLSPAVQVEALAQQVERHDDALGVPAGPAGAPRRRPSSARPAWPSSTARSRAASASPRRPRPAPRPATSRGSGAPAGRSRRPARRRGRRRRRLVGDSPGDQVGHQRHHVVHVGGGVRGVVGAQDAEAVHGLPPAGLELERHLGLGPPLFGGPLDDLVVDVGDVRHVVDVEPAEDQVAPQDVEDEVEAPVPEVGQVVDGRAAHVHRRLALGAQLERPHGARRGVV